MQQVQFNLEYLTTHGIIQKVNPFILGCQTTHPCLLLFFFPELVNTFRLHQPLLYLKSDCNKFTWIAHFKHSLSLDLIADSKVVFIQYR